MPITSSSRPVSSARDCCSTSPSHIPGSSGPPSHPGYAPSDPGSRPPNSSSPPRYASGFLNSSWIPRNTTSSRNSSPTERIPIKCRASNAQLERKFWANPRLSRTDDDSSKEDGYEVDGHTVTSIFETKDRRQAGLYVVKWDDGSAQYGPMAGSPVLIITVF